MCKFTKSNEPLRYYPLKWNQFEVSAFNQAILKKKSTRPATAYAEGRKNTIVIAHSIFVIVKFSFNLSTMVALVIWINLIKIRSISIRRFEIVTLILMSFVDVADPVHIVTEQARKDSSRQVLCSSRRFRETQGRIRGMIMNVILRFLQLLFELFNFLGFWNLDAFLVGSSVGGQQRSQVY